MKNFSENEYKKKIDRKVPKSNILKNCFFAFLTGGAICTIGQFVLNFYKSLNLSEELSGAATSITMIFLGVLLTALDVYWKIARFSGAGTLVPITGFANAVSSPSIEAKTEGYVLGVGVKLFSIAGPVIVFGTVASMVAGIIYYVLR